MKTTLRILSRIILVATIMNTVNASDLITCVSHAEKICSELKDKNEFIQCFNDVTKSCIEDLQVSLKSNQDSCIDECHRIPETTARLVCISHCKAL